MGSKYAVHDGGGAAADDDVGLAGPIDVVVLFEKGCAPLPSDGHADFTGFATTRVVNSEETIPRMGYRCMATWESGDCTRPGRKECVLRWSYKAKSQCSVLNLWLHIYCTGKMISETIPNLIIITKDHWEGASCFSVMLVDL